jgi:hypothetical protein
MSVNDAITEYYELKGQYYSKYNRLKHNILRSDSSISIKRKKVKRIKMKCINCKKMSGTIFERNDKVISAVCGDTIDPCNLDIKINTGIYDTTANLNSLTYDSLEQAKFKIMQIKFLLLFNLGEEMELIADFNTLKQTYKSFVQLQDLIDDVIKTNNSIKMDTVEGETYIDRNVLADINIIKLDNLISSFKELLTNYQDEKKSAAQSGIMIDAMDLYINEIIPTEKIIQENLYNIKQVIKEGDLYKVVQIKTKLDDMMIELLEPEIISNKK